MISSLVFNDRVPREVSQNIRYRRAILKAAAEDDEVKNDLFFRCKHDVLYFFNAFMFTYDPRVVSCPSVPFVTYPFQESAILKLDKHLGRRDVLIEKSRDMGASWICTGVLFHRWMFFDMQSFLLGSRKEEYVDKTGDMKGLFQKIDFAIDHLPGWMVPLLDRTKLHLLNRRNGSSIDGESTNSNFARGGRWTAILKDEFGYVDNDYEVESASRDATNCRIYNSTPNGVHKVFYEKREKLAREAPDQLIRLHWTEHPKKAKGLYTSIDGVLKILDESFEFPEDYPFILDEKIRSVWYDIQCQRAANDQEIGQEIDIDYKKSGWQYFDPVKLDQVKARCVRNPVLIGDVSFNSDVEDCKFFPDEGGRIKLWVAPLLNDDFPLGGYTLGVDIATGKGGVMSSNSVASLVNNVTGEKVLEFADNRTNPTEFADICIAICKMFHKAFLIWEDNGPGGQFGTQVRNRNYLNIFYRRNEKSSKNGRSDVAGWWTNAETKRSLLGEYARAIFSGEFVNPSEDSLVECGEYVHDHAKGIVHAKSMSRTDPTVTGDNHGDRVIADALAHRGRKERAVVRNPTPIEAPVGSMGWRMLQAKLEKSKSSWVA